MTLKVCGLFFCFLFFSKWETILTLKDCPSVAFTGMRNSGVRRWDSITIIPTTAATAATAKKRKMMDVTRKTFRQLWRLRPVL